MTITYADVEKAASRIKPHAVRTPLIRSDILDEICGARVFLKPENMQRTGSFKFRGATNAILALMEEGNDLAAKGVIACSSGNHAQGVAEAARMNGVPATIVMPHDAPVIKVVRTERSGAEVVYYDRANEDRDTVAQREIDERGGVFIHPYENPFVIAGQGTCALEVADDFGEKGISPERILVCTGGGGLSAGVSVVMRKHFPDAKFHTVEPAGFDDYKRSLEIGERVANDKTSGSLCDAIITPSPGKVSFGLLNGYASEGLLVSDGEALSAVAFAYNELKMVLEPGGAVTLAALLSQKIDVKGETVFATLSGGNVDPEIFARALAL